MVQVRKKLRNNPTKEEVRLWLRLKNKQLGFKFIRQYSIGSYVVDFYCPQKRLAVELDGGQHNDEKTIVYDRTRTSTLEELDIRVIRFWNGDVYNKIEVVIEEIWRSLVSPP